VNKKLFLRYWQLCLLILLPMLYLIIFKYIPMFGIQIAFRDYSPANGVWGSTWVGLDHFRTFFSSPRFMSIVGNTVKISSWISCGGALCAVGLHPKKYVIEPPSRMGGLTVGRPPYKIAFLWHRLSVALLRISGQRIFIFLQTCCSHIRARRSNKLVRGTSLYR